MERFEHSDEDNQTSKSEANNLDKVFGARPADLKPLTVDELTGKEPEVEVEDQWSDAPDYADWKKNQTNKEKEKELEQLGELRRNRNQRDERDKAA